MKGKRYLIANADDFGQSPGVNQGVIEAHERGIVTSASLMVRWSGAIEAATYGREHRALSVGLHVDLGEWAYQDGSWVPLYEVVRLEDVPAVTDEVWRQLDRFRSLLRRDPTHMDSHQHVHLRAPVRSILVEIARRISVPLRHCSREIRYCGSFYGQTAEGSSLPDAISVDGLLRILPALRPGITELACHPGRGGSPNSRYHSERAQELKVLCDPRVKTVIAAAGIRLHSFHGITARAGEGCA